MTEQTTNPYQLAQYIVASPDKKIMFNTFDADPILQKLPDHLKMYVFELFLLGDAGENLLLEQHPNALEQKLAMKADEFCPGRTTSDLLLKHEIVHDVMNSIMSGLRKAALNRPSGIRAIDILLRTMTR